MNNIPHELKYTRSHEWIRKEDDGSYTVGITDHAQGLLGDMVYIELPEPGDEFESGQECGVVESVKAASDVYAPLTGEIVAVNEELADAPETVNSDPFNDGWLFRITLHDETEYDNLLDAEAYAAVVEEEDH